MLKERKRSICSERAQSAIPCPPMRSERIDNSSTDAIDLIPSPLYTTFDALPELWPLKPLHFWQNKLHKFSHEARNIGSSKYLKEYISTHNEAIVLI